MITSENQEQPAIIVCSADDVIADSGSLIMPRASASLSSAPESRCELPRLCYCYMYIRQSISCLQDVNKSKLIVLIVIKIFQDLYGNAS